MGNSETDPADDISPSPGEPRGNLRLTPEKLLAALLSGVKVLVVYADAAYFDKRIFRVVQDVLGAYALLSHL